MRNGSVFVSTGHGLNFSSQTPLHKEHGATEGPADARARGRRAPDPSPRVPVRSAPSLGVDLGRLELSRPAWLSVVARQNRRMSRPKGAYSPKPTYASPVTGRRVSMKAVVRVIVVVGVCLAGWRVLREGPSKQDTAETDLVQVELPVASELLQPGSPHASFRAALIPGERYITSGHAHGNSQFITPHHTPHYYNPQPPGLSLASLTVYHSIR